MKVLVLDATHGGQILTRRYISAGDRVTLADVYRIAPDALIKEMTALGAEFVRGSPSGDYDLVTMPCHCPDMFLENCTYKDRIWFSQSVNRFMDDPRRRIEITGVKGKTSTCYILAYILDSCGMKVYLSSSRGAGPFEGGSHRIECLKSIAPPYLLDLPEGDYDVMINEVSLGGSGKADIACITNLLEDYGIAKKTRKASEAKKDILCDGVNLVPQDEVGFWSGYGKKITGFPCSVEAIGRPVFGESLKVAVDYDGVSEISLDPSYLSLQYLKAMGTAISIAHAMDVPKDKVLSALETFKGVPGRGEIRESDGIRYVIERNPGISHMSVEWTLSCLEDMDALEDSVLIIDPVSKKVCDKLDRDLIAEVAKNHGVDLIVTPGDGTEPDVPSGKRTVIRMTKEGYQ